LRGLPAVDAVIRSGEARTLVQRHGRAATVSAVREALDGARREILSGSEPDVSEGAVLSRASGLLAGRGLRRVVNATGVVLHTNLGRSVLSERAVDAAMRAARGYSNLEYDLGSGARGSRYDHAVPILKELTGAEDALVVNNCAGATLLALSAVVREARKDGIGSPEVVVSRGQLIEIGGGFRIPEVLELSGAALREVGTTNRTRLSDYEEAVEYGGEAIRGILWVHPSNFEVVGFAESVGFGELAALGRGAGLPVVADVGSGALLPAFGEPRVGDVVRSGAALTVFSGDKLLGGPQAGIVVGESRWISAMRRHPLTRALRADKLCLAALEATLSAYLEGVAPDELPTQRMLHAPPEEVRRRAERLAERLRQTRLSADVVPSVARSGGGTLPTREIASYAVRLLPSELSADVLAGRLRGAEVPVVGRVYEGAVLLDARTLLDGDEELVVAAVERAVG